MTWVETQQTVPLAKPVSDHYDVIALLVNKGAVSISKSQTLDAGHPFSSLLAGLEGFSEVQRLPVPQGSVSLVGAQASHDSGDTSKTIKTLTFRRVN